MLLNNNTIFTYHKLILQHHNTMQQSSYHMNKKLKMIICKLPNIDYN